MRKSVPLRLENGRSRNPEWAGYGFNGMFEVTGPCAEKLRIVASDADNPWGELWEHVSVSCARRCPNWVEMSFVKDLFWDDEECVVQFHPPKSQHINNHPFVLHLWRHALHSFPMPPSVLVGVKELGDVSQNPALAITAMDKL